MLLSIGFHALALGHMAGLYQTKPVNYLEVEIRMAEKPPETSIPAPPRQQKATPQPKAQTKKIKKAKPAVKPETPPPAPEPIVENLSVTVPIATPETPRVSAIESIDRQPAGRVESAETTSEDSSSDYGSSTEYYGMVRMMIEKNKLYPLAARQRQIQGRVVVRFVISADGSVTDIALVESCRHKILDKAALAAIQNAGPFPRPPMQLFKGSVPLEIPVVFELR
jgi:protein TonB